MAYPDSILLIGTRAAQPAATDVAPGTLYSVTDESNLVEQSDGAAWATYAGAGGGGGAIGLSAGTQSVSTGTVVFSNSNGITFGMSGSSLITASHNGLTSQSNQAASAGNGSFAFQTVLFSDASGISFSTSAGSAIYAAHNGLTSQSNQALSAANGSFAFQTAIFSDANGLSFSTSAGSAIFGSYTRPVVSNAIQAVGSASGSGTNTSRFAADDHVHPGVFSLGVTNAGNTVGNTRVDVGRFVLQGGNNVTLSQITAANALNTIIISGANAGGVQTGISGIVASDATYTSGSVYFSNQANVTIGSSVDGASQYVRLSVHAPQTGLSGLMVSDATYTSGTVSFSNANGLTFGSSGANVVTASHNGLTSQSNQNVTAANGGFAFQTLSFSNANNFTFATSAGSAIVGSYTVPTVPAQLSVGNSNLGNTAGDTGVFTGRVVFVGSNNITLSGSSNAGSATVSILGGGATPITLSQYALIPVGGFGGPVPFAQTSFSMINNSLHVYPVVLTNYVTADHFRMPVLAFHSSSANASIQKGLTYLVGLYTRHSTDAAVITQHYSTSYTIAASHNSNVSWMQSMITAINNSTSYATMTTSSGGVLLSSLIQGNRELILPLSSLLSPGEYWVGVKLSTSGVGSAGSLMNFSNLAIMNQTSNRVGIGTTQSGSGWYQAAHMGIYSVTTAAMPDSIGVTDLNQAATMPLMFLATGTV
jgi:hypothetical protein